MTVQAPQALTPLAATAITLAAVASTDTVVTDTSKQYVLVVVNGGGSSDTVAITASGKDIFGRTISAMSVAVANGVTRYIWLPRQEQLADGSTGLITITHSFTTSVTCAVIAIPTNV